MAEGKVGSGVLWGLVLFMATASHAGTTVTYIYSDPQGTPLAEADADGRIIKAYDYVPYGVQVMGSTSSGPGYTGHVGDPDTQLIYMQARYYDPLIGRFLSPDPVLPGPARLSTFNVYSYASNNPLKFTDPNGMYVCQGTQQCDTFRDRIKRVGDAARRLPQGAGKDKLKAVLQAYGPEGGKGQVNGQSVNVTVNFANLGPNVFGQTTVDDNGGGITVTFNETEMASSFPKGSMSIETAATAAHEGQHIVDFVNRRIHAGFDGKLKSETEAFLTQSYVNEAFGVRSHFDVWDPRWSSSDVEHYRKLGSYEAATTEAYALCPARKCD